MTDLTAVSLFAGVGGFDLALEQNGVKVVAAVEIDKHARGVLERRFPDTTLFEDVTEVTGDQLRAAGFVPERGIITGGFPCQDLSVAGKRAGLEGGRSGLFWHIVRLAKELQPKWLILENVPGLLSSNGGQDMGTVLGALGECGYGFAYRVLDAQYFGVPQRRRRVFIVCCLGDSGGAPAEVLALSEGVCGYFEAGGKSRKATATSARNSTEDSGGAVGTLTSEAMPPFDVPAYGGEIIPTVTAKWRFGSGGPSGDECQNLIVSQSPRYIQGYGDVQPLIEITGTMTTRWAGHYDSVQEVQSGAVVPMRITYDNPQEADNAARRLTPMECERLQGFPDNWTEGQSDSARYRQMGNAVAVPVVEGIIDRLVDNDDENLVTSRDDLNDVVIGSLTTRSGSSPRGSETSDSRHLVIEPMLFDGGTHGDVRTTVDVAPTLAARMGTGGGNTPMVVQNIPFAQNQQGELRELGDATGAITTQGSAANQVTMLVQRTLAFDTQFGSNANVFENISLTLKASQASPSFISGFDTYNGDLTGDVAHTVRFGNSEGTPAVLVGQDDE